MTLPVGAFLHSLTVVYSRLHKEAFKLEFLVPIHNALESMTFSSNITWREFCYQIAMTKDVKREDLKLAYKFSTAKVKDLGRHLNTQAHLSSLFDAALEIMQVPSKTKGKTKKQELHVVLIDLSPKEKNSKTKVTNIPFQSISVR